MIGGISFSPQSMADWLPLAKVAGFFLASMALEDVVALGAGVLLATGHITWPAAFGACFLGIWCGDTAIYGLARFAGRGWFERSPLRRFAPKVARSEQWFTERGVPVLIFSRMVPCARLPTYLAAGFLRVPLPRFLFITGAATLVWTFTVLRLAETFGGRLVRWLDVYQHAWLALVGAGIVLIGLWWLRRKLCRKWEALRAQSDEEL